jgi:hypothetical protein
MEMNNTESIPTTAPGRSVELNLTLLDQYQNVMVSVKTLSLSARFECPGFESVPALSCQHTAVA